MIGYWIAFYILLILIPIGNIGFLMFAKMRQNFSNDQLKQFIPRTIFYIFFLWLADLLYMAIFNNRLVWIFIFGGLIVFIDFVDLVSAFVKSMTNNKIPMIWLAVELLFALALTTYLIFIIPNETLQTIILTMTAAVYGGFITLLGVSWTIKTTDKNRHEDLLLKARPVFSFENVNDTSNIKDYPKSCLTNFIEECDCKCAVNVVIENSNLNSFNLVSVIHDGKEFNLIGNLIVLPNAKHLLQFNFDECSDIYLKIRDTQNVFHYYNLKLLFASSFKTASKSIIYTVKEFVPATVEDVNKALNQSIEINKGNN